MRHPALERLKDRLDLRLIPFTERGSRLLVFQDDRGLWLGQAEYETPVRETTVFSALHIDDEAGRGLELTSYPDHLRFDTALGSFRLTFADPETLLLVVPAGRFGLRFETPFALTTDAQGGVGERGGVTFSYTTQATLLENDVRADRVRLELNAETGDVLGFNVTHGRPVRRRWEANEALKAACARWGSWFDAVPDVLDPWRERYLFAWWVMGVNLLRMRFAPRYEGVVPSKLGYVGIWHWDAYFHALALRHLDPELAKNQLRVLLEHQLANGMIPDVVHDTGVLAHSSAMVARDQLKSLKYVGATSSAGRAMMQAPITKPPLTAWAAWKVYEADGDPSFLAEVYDAVVHSQRWWLRENDTDGNGLCEYLHPYSSGVDDGPLWDQGPPVESPDLNSYLILQADHLAKMARVLGKPEEVNRWQREAQCLTERLIECQWDADAGLFWATRYGERLKARTPFNLYPLLIGRLPKEIAARLVATLTDEGQFWSRYPVPTVALDDPAFDPERMWRGPVWLNPNYLLIEGLFRMGYPEVARELRRRTLELITETESPMGEYHHPLTGEKPPRATVMFGWTAALFIDLAIAATQDRAVGKDDS